MTRRETSLQSAVVHRRQQSRSLHVDAHGTTIREEASSGTEGGFRDPRRGEMICRCRLRSTLPGMAMYIVQCLLYDASHRGQPVRVLPMRRQSLSLQSGMGNSGRRGWILPRIAMHRGNAPSGTESCLEAPRRGEMIRRRWLRSRLPRMAMYTVQCLLYDASHCGQPARVLPVMCQSLTLQSAMGQCGRRRWILHIPPIAATHRGKANSGTEDCLEGPRRGELICRCKLHTTLPGMAMYSVQCLLYDVSHCSQPVRVLPMRRQSLSLQSSMGNCGRRMWIPHSRPTAATHLGKACMGTEDCFVRPCRGDTIHRCRLRSPLPGANLCNLEMHSPSVHGQRAAAATAAALRTRVCSAERRSHAVNLSMCRGTQQTHAIHQFTLAAANCSKRRFGVKAAGLASSYFGSIVNKKGMSRAMRPTALVTSTCNRQPCSPVPCGWRATATSTPTRSGQPQL